MKRTTNTPERLLRISAQDRDGRRTIYFPVIREVEGLSAARLINSMSRYTGDVAIVEEVSLACLRVTR